MCESCVCESLCVWCVFSGSNCAFAPSAIMFGVCVCVRACVCVCFQAEILLLLPRHSCVCVCVCVCACVFGLHMCSDGVWAL